jgi:hypothetical protein
MQIMRQTGPLQRAVMSGKMTDKDNVQNWILNQPDVLIRLNNRLIGSPSKVISLERVHRKSQNSLQIISTFLACNELTTEKFGKATSLQKSQCILENSKYLTRKGKFNNLVHCFILFLI